MNRRSFVQSGVLSVAGAGIGMARTSERQTQMQGATFKLNYAPHFGMFASLAGRDLLDQLQFMYDEGFRAFEDNEMRNRPVETQEAIASRLGSLGMQMGVFVAHTIEWSEPGLVDSDKHERFLSEVRSSVDVAKRVNATWMTVVPGHVNLRIDPALQTANVIDVLRRACDILEPHELVMVLEPLNFRDHPGQFLTSVPQAFEICKAVNSPSCRILNDLYHQQIQVGNLIPNLDAAWPQTAYFQIGDNPGRKEPGTGEINYLNVFGHIHSKGYTGILGMEHGMVGSGKEGERALIEAYREVDSFAAD
ncbi:MAG: TIM barrel protein [Bacteroidetes bacterium]|nr:TIM barrel protein [Bacteroidota bacterium]